MLLSRQNDDEYRMKNRINSIGNLAHEILFIESAQNLLLLDPESEEFLNEFANFSSIFKEYSTPKNIAQLKSIGFDVYLQNLLGNHKDPFVIQRCLSCIYTWICQHVQGDLLFFHQEFALYLSSIALSPELKDQRSYLLSFAILKTIFNYSPQCISVLIDSEIIKNLLNFYFDCPEEKIQAEILCTLYSLVKSKQIPFEMMTDIASVISKILSATDNSNLDIVLALSSAFAECGNEYSFLLLECLPFDQLFLSFENFSNNEQESFLRLLISIFDYSETKDLSIIIDYFKWESILSFVDRPSNDLIIQYFVTLLSSAFQKSCTLISSASEAEVFQLLFKWIETEKYSIQNASLIAVLKAFEYGFNIVGLPLLDVGLIPKIIFLLDCNSVILAEEVCKVILILHNFAEESNKTVLSETLKVECATELLESIENGEELPSDLLEIIKASLEEVQVSSLWQ